MNCEAGRCFSLAAMIVAVALIFGGGCEKKKIIILPPGPVMNPVPPDGATGISITQELSWDEAQDTIEYGVYFGELSPGVLVSLQNSTSYSPLGMNYGTTYYWRIDSRHPLGTTVGPVWEFRTGEPPTGPPAAVTNPNPPDDATGVSLTKQLSWDAANGATGYGVYFGTSSPGTFQGNQAGTTFDPGLLAADTSYYWRVDPYNAYGTTTGNAWSFKTVLSGTPGGSLAWAKSAGGVWFDQGFGISALPDGSALVTGSFEGTATFGAGEGNETVLASAGSLDIFVAKYNPDGTLNWAKSAGGGNWDAVYGISTLSDGSAVVTGSFEIAATFGAGEGNETILSSAGAGDIFIAKYNPDGSLNWATSAGGGSDDGGSGISALSDGSALVTGVFSGTATFGNWSEGGNQTDLTSAGNQDLFIAKYNPDGTLNWAKSAGGANNDGAYGISALPDGSAIVTGYFGGTATFGAGEGNETVLSSAGNADIFIAKYNPNGTLAWAKSAGGTIVDIAEDISALSDGSAVVTGQFSGSATFGAGEGNQTVLTLAGVRNIFIAKYNPDGTLAWAKSAGGVGWDYGYGISALPDGSAIVTGAFDSTPAATFGAGEANETVLTSAGSYDIFIAKYNPDGTLAWVKSAGGENWDEGCGVSALTDGSAVVTGYFESAAIFGAGEGNETVLVSSGGREIFIAKFNP